MFNIKELEQLRTAIYWCPEDKQHPGINQQKLKNKLSDLLILQQAWNRNKRIDFAWDDECNEPLDDKTSSLTLIQ